MAEATEKKAADAPTHTVERLIAEAGDFLGVPSHVVAGALHGSKKKELTLDEARSAIAEFEAHEVEIDNPVGSNNVKEGR